MGIDFNQIIEVESEEEKNAVVERLMTNKSPDKIKAIRENLGIVKNMNSIHEARGLDSEMLQFNTDSVSFVQKTMLSNGSQMVQWLDSLDNTEFRRVMRHLEQISKMKGV